MVKQRTLNQALKGWAVPLELALALAGAICCDITHRIFDYGTVEFTLKKIGIPLVLLFALTSAIGSQVSNNRVLNRGAVDFTLDEVGVPLIVFLTLTGSVGGDVPQRIFNDGTVKLALKKVGVPLVFALTLAGSVGGYVPDRIFQRRAV